MKDSLIANLETLKQSDVYIVRMTSMGRLKDGEVFIDGQ